MEKYLQWINTQIEEIVEKVKNKKNLVNENYKIGQIDAYLKMKQYLKTEYIMGTKGALN